MYSIVYIGITFAIGPVIKKIDIFIFFFIFIHKEWQTDTWKLCIYIVYNIFYPIKNAKTCAVENDLTLILSIFYFNLWILQAKF